MHRVTLDVPGADVVADPEAAARDGARRLAAGATRGASVAVGAGSRGFTDRVAVLRGTVAGLRDGGLEPFVVPAMGSHGGSDADGQVATLTRLGIDEASVGAPIRATMDTVVVTTTPEGMPVHLDAHAAAADHFLPVNRVKAHTSFRGPIESGCTKMAVIGFGKAAGATELHARGPAALAERLLAGAHALRDTGRLLGGVAVVERADGATSVVDALVPDDVGGPGEIALTEHARTLLPRLPFEEIDVLVVERGGKDLSGTLVDPNVTGRFWLPGIDDLDAPRVGVIVLLSLTPASAGNAMGIGLVDLIPRSVADAIDWNSTYANARATGIGGLRRARCPMVLDDEPACIQTAIAMCGRPATEVRMVRIDSTLHLTEAWVSDAVLRDTTRAT